MNHIDTLKEMRDECLYAVDQGGEFKARHQRDVDALTFAIQTLEMVEAAEAIYFKDKSRVIWTSMNGVWKWEPKLSLTHGLCQRLGTATEAFTALQQEKA